MPVMLSDNFKFQNPDQMVEETDYLSTKGTPRGEERHNSQPVKLVHALEVLLRFVVSLQYLKMFIGFALSCTSKLLKQM